MSQLYDAPRSIGSSTKRALRTAIQRHALKFAMSLTACDQCFGVGCTACNVGNPSYQAPLSLDEPLYIDDQSETKVICEHDWRASKTPGWASWCCKCDLRTKEARHK